MSALDVTIFEIVPHPQHPGDWLLKPYHGHGVPLDAGAVL
jgi:hypothetical protein